jgi:hypothetical protein
VIAQAREVVIASDCKPQNDELTYEHSNRMLHGWLKFEPTSCKPSLFPWQCGTVSMKTAWAKPPAPLAAGSSGRRT